MKNKKVIFLIATFFYTTSIFSQDEFLFSPKGIAEVHITMLNGKNINDIQNEKQTSNYKGKLEAEMVIKNSESSTYEEGDFYSGRILIDGRGNTSWGADKKPYSVDLVDDSGMENPKSILGMPSCDEWVLLALWNDASMIRVPLAMYLGQRMNGIPWTPRMRYVEVWIDNDYRGLYCFIEKVQRGNDRADVKKLTDSAEDQKEPRISGGYILEASGDNDKNKALEIATAFRAPKSGVQFVFKYPKPKNVTTEQRNWIKNHVAEFENMLWNENQYKDPDTGYKQYINEESFIDWTILHEISKSVDCHYHASVFVQKDRNGKLAMTAPWDYDLAFGYHWNNENAASSRKDDGNWIRTNENRWPGRLAKDENYAKKYRGRFDELMPLFNQIPEVLLANYEQLEAAGVLERDNDRWPRILLDYVCETRQVRPTSTKDQIRYVSEWIESRVAWCYVVLGTTSGERGERIKNIRPVIRVMDHAALDKGEDFVVKVMAGYSYVWSDQGNRTTTSSRAIDKDGIYTVQLRDSWGNLSLPSKPLIRGDFTNIQTPESNDEFSYSNPVRDILTLNYTTDKNSSMKIELVDTRGMLVKEQIVAITSGYNHTQMDTSGLGSGIYLLRVTTGSKTISGKVIVIK